MPPTKRATQQLPSGRHGLSRSFVVHNQRERMLAAVADAVSEKGYARYSVEDVVERSGVSRRTFYQQFKNKEDAFLAAYDAGVGQLVERVSSAYESREGPVDRLHAGIGEFLAVLAGDPAFARMCIVEVLGAGPAALERRAAAMGAFASIIEANARELVPELEPAGLIAETVVGGVYEVVFARLVAGQVEQLPDLLPELIHTVVLLMLGPEAAAEYRAASQGTV